MTDALAHLMSASANHVAHSFQLSLQLQFVLMLAGTSFMQLLLLFFSTGNKCVGGYVDLSCVDLPCVCVVGLSLTSSATFTRTDFTSGGGTLRIT
jgi:hypothetical protein